MAERFVMRCLAFSLFASLLAGCSLTASEPALDENVSQGSDDLAPALVCSEPHVTTNGEAEASSIACEPGLAPIPVA